MSPGLSGGFEPESVDAPGFGVLDFEVPQGLPLNFVGGLLVAGVAKLTDGDGTTTTGGGSGIVTADAEGITTGSGGNMLDCTTKNATPPAAKTNSTVTNQSVDRLRDPSSSGGGEIRSPLEIPGAVVGAAFCTDATCAAGVGTTELSMPG